jgi:hypothetical protein
LQAFDEKTQKHLVICSLLRTFAAELQQKTIMKKYLMLFLMLGCAYGAQATDFDGKYLSLSGELLFRFKGDSLYIDIAQSQRNISAFKLVQNTKSKQTTTFNAFESFLENGQVTYREVLIRMTKEKGKTYLLEYSGKDKDREYHSNESYHVKLVE